MVSEEIYISINANNYKSSKISVLKCQANLLNSLKNLQRISFYSKQKNELKKKLHQKITSLKTEINSFEKKLPEIEIPKELKKESEMDLELIKDFTKRDRIDEELIMIQKKLEELNDWIE